MNTQYITIEMCFYESHKYNIIRWLWKGIIDDYKVIYEDSITMHLSWTQI